MGKNEANTLFVLIKSDFFNRTNKFTKIEPIKMFKNFINIKSLSMILLFS